MSKDGGVEYDVEAGMEQGVCIEQEQLLPAQMTSPPAAPLPVSGDARAVAIMKQQHARLVSVIKGLDVALNTRTMRYAIFLQTMMIIIFGIMTAPLIAHGYVHGLDTGIQVAAFISIGGGVVAMAIGWCSVMSWAQRENNNVEVAVKYDRDIEMDVPFYMRDVACWRFSDTTNSIPCVVLWSYVKDSRVPQIRDLAIRDRHVVAERFNDGIVEVATSDGGNVLLDSGRVVKFTLEGGLLRIT